MAPKPNFYKKTISPSSGSNNGRILLKRPTTVKFDDMELGLSPNVGQPLRIREQYQLKFTEASQGHVYSNENRYLATTNCGFYQHMYLDQDSEYLIARDGQINASRVGGGGNWKHTSSYEYNYQIFREFEDFYGGILSQVASCNADLQPAAVPNSFINEENVLDYIRLLAKLAAGDFDGTIEDVIDLFAPTTAGYRFSESKSLFTATTQAKIVDLVDSGDGIIRTAIGDLGLWVNPGFELDECIYTIEIREFGQVEKYPVQIDQVIACLYVDEFAVPFPGGEPANSCLSSYNARLAEFANFPSVYQGRTFGSPGEARSYAAGQGLIESAYQLSSEGYRCPTDATFFRQFYWIVLN